MTARRRWRFAAKLALVLVLAGLTVPNATVRPATFSLTEVETAKDVDFSDGVVWILALGSDARPGQDVLEGNSDAIQLVGLDLASGRAAGIGIPRDSWLEIPGHGLDRINQAMSLGGQDLTAEVVADLVGIQPNYVSWPGSTGSGRWSTASAGSSCSRTARSGTTSSTSTYRRDANEFNGTEALDYTRTRQLPASDFARSANQQGTMLGILEGLRAHEDEEGFMERGRSGGTVRPRHRPRADRALPPGPGGHPDPSGPRRDLRADRRHRDDLGRCGSGVPRRGSGYARSERTSART